VPLAVDGVTIDVEREGEQVCVAAVHVDPDMERSLVDPTARAAMPARMTIPMVDAPGIRGTLSVWSGRSMAPVEEAFVCGAAAHAGTVLSSRLPDYRGALLAMVGHELRAPLQAIEIGVELIRVRATNTADEMPREWTVQRCDRVRSSVRRLASVADTLLGVTMIDAGAISVDVRSGELGEIVVGVIERHGDALTWAGADVAVVQQRRERGSWDVFHVDTIVSNLLSNAVKYAGRSPIQVVVDGEDDRVTIAVEDRGPGVPEADRARIFDRYSRADVKTTVPGLGLGLWLARALAEAQGGTLTHRPRVGGGSSFVLELPREVCASVSDRASFGSAREAASR
jgi:signal transduction histidine kinase